MISDHASDSISNYWEHSGAVLRDVDWCAVSALAFVFVHC